MNSPTTSGSISDYYSAVQLRQDRWSTLRDTCEQLARFSESNAPEAKVAKAVGKASGLLAALSPIKMYWAFPGRTAFEHLRKVLDSKQYDDLAFSVRRISRALTTGAYRRRAVPLARSDGEFEESDDDLHASIESRTMQKPYFEVLIVDQTTDYQERFQRQSLQRLRREEDAFIYEAVVTPSLEDALIAILFNHNIQAVVVRPGLTLKSKNQLPVLQRYLTRLQGDGVDDLDPQHYGPELCRQIAKVRPELDAYLITDRSAEDVAGLDLGLCRRVFYNQEDFLELHLNILRGVAARNKTPFFSALVEYSKQPTGVFHAMPISRGKSITRSHWIQDMGAFYGPNIFLAETSATSGGLDSLLEPHGPIKEAQERAAVAFGSKQTFFATNGTSTCNKIVVQALVRPGDIVLVDRHCHKSHHYGMVLAGAQVVYLES